MGYRWGCIDNDHSHHQVVVLWLEAHHDEGKQIHPDKETIQKTNADAIVAAITDKMDDTCQETNSQQSPCHQETSAEMGISDGKLEVEEGREVRNER